MTSHMPACIAMIQMIIIIMKKQKKSKNLLNMIFTTLLFDDITKLIFAK